MSDDLRQALRRIDPSPADTPVDRVDSPSARRLLGEIMTASTDTDTDILAGEPPRSRRRWPLAAAAGVVVLAAAAVGIGVAATGDDDPAAPPAETLALTLPDPLSMSSCLMFDVNVLAQMPVAFGGAVTAVDADSVTLDVDRWYKGGDADVVELQLPGANTSASLDGVEFREGASYLVTASEEGMVNGCGFSGAATPDLQRSYEEAFAG